MCTQERKLTFRSGHYTGRGWEVDEFAASLAQGVPNHGAQLGWYMVCLTSTQRSAPCHTLMLILTCFTPDYRSR